jgi:hypothetical protein
VYGSPVPMLPSPTRFRTEEGAERETTIGTRGGSRTQDTRRRARREKLQQPFKTGALSTSKGAQTGGAGAIRSVVWGMFAVNPKELAEALD